MPVVNLETPLFNLHAAGALHTKTNRAPARRGQTARSSFSLSSAKERRACSPAVCESLLRSKLRGRFIVKLVKYVLKDAKILNVSNSEEEMALGCTRLRVRQQFSLFIISSTDTGFTRPIAINI